MGKRDPVDTVFGTNYTHELEMRRRALLLIKVRAANTVGLPELSFEEALKIVTEADAAPRFTPMESLPHTNNDEILQADI